ncbi:hypothetical protein BDV93DRAFT_571895 [Ceratobasidium sp. AG-I]|nr:hypothetical protein BDV93DRAFT_571895 [Ceratobasidium sp. AG-I]
MAAKKRNNVFDKGKGKALDKKRPRDDSDNSDGDNTSGSNDSIWPLIQVNSITIAEIRVHLSLSLSTHDAECLRIRALFREFMCMATLDFDIPWKQQDMIRERIPRFCRFANNWAAELVVQDIFNLKRTHLLKLERQKKNPETGRASKNPNGARKGVNSKETEQRSGASESRHSPPSSSTYNTSPPGSPSTPNRGCASPTGWMARFSRQPWHRFPAGPHDNSHTAPGALPAEPSPPPGSTRQPNERPLQGGAGSTCEHGGRNEARDETVCASPQSGAELSQGRNAGERDEEAPSVPRRGGLRARVGLVAAALAAADGADEDDDNARKGSGGRKKGAKRKANARPKPKPKKGKDEELFPNAGEEEDGDD